MLVQCTRVNTMFEMLPWVYIHTGQAWKKCLVRFPPWPGIFFKLVRCGYTAQSNITNIILTNCRFFMWSSYKFAADGLSASFCIGSPAWRLAAGYWFAAFVTSFLCWKFCVCIFFGGSRWTTGPAAGLVPREKLRTTGYSGPMSPGGRVAPGAGERKQIN